MSKLQQIELQKELQDKIDKLQNERGDLLVEIQELRKEAKEHTDFLADKQKSIDKIEARKLSVEKRTEKARAEYATSKEELKVTISAVEKTRKNAQVEIQKIQCATMLVHAECSEESKKLTKIRNSIDHLESQYQEFTSQAERAQRQREREEKRVKQAQETLEKITQEGKKQKAENLKVIKELDGIRDNIKVERKKVEKFVQRINLFKEKHG